MIFNDILKKKDQLLAPEFAKLYDQILKKQTHPGDLLLIKVNGFYNPEVHTWNNLDKPMSPYIIGPNSEGHSEWSHYSFIHNYRTQVIHPTSYDVYLKEVEWSSERSEEINRLSETEGLSIQMEMMIYLKIWEADLFIKKLYQLVRLVSGEPYDWHFKLPKDNKRDKSVTGLRHEIIRLKVRDRLKEDFPNIYAAINNAYKSQIRNSIAHSKYSLVGRYIQLNNMIREEAPLYSISFEDWTDIFHDTLMIYNQVIRIFNEVDSTYSKAVQSTDLLMEIRINKKDPVEATEYHFLKYRPEWKDWHFNDSSTEENTNTEEKK